MSCLFNFFKAIIFRAVMTLVKRFVLSISRRLMLNHCDRLQAYLKRKNIFRILIKANATREKHI